MIIIATLRSRVTINLIQVTVQSASSTVVLGMVWLWLVRLGGADGTNDKRTCPGTGVEEGGLSPTTSILKCRFDMPSTLNNLFSKWKSCWRELKFLIYAVWCWRRNCFRTMDFNYFALMGFRNLFDSLTLNNRPLCWCDRVLVAVWL